MYVSSVIVTIIVLVLIFKLVVYPCNSVSVVNKQLILILFYKITLLYP